MLALRWFTLRHDLREESKGTKDGEEALRTALEGAEGRRRPSCSVDPFEPRPSLSMLALRWFTLRHGLCEESKGTKDREEASRTGFEGAEGRRRSSCSFAPSILRPFDASPFDLRTFERQQSFFFDPFVPFDPSM